METYQRPQVSCRLINDNHQAEKERYWRNLKNRKIQKKVRIVYNSECVRVLCLDLLTRPKMPFKVMHRKEMTHSNGS